MLQRIETQVRHVGRFGMPEDAKDTAFFLEFVEAHATCFAKYCSTAPDQTRSASDTPTAIAS